MSRTYVAFLAAVAALILAVGLALRGLLHRGDGVTAAPPSEASTLQQMSERAQMRRTSDYVAERIAAVAPFVEHVSAVASSGIRWGGGDSVLATRAGWPILALRVAATDSLRSAPVPLSDSIPPELMLIVGRRANGQVISATTHAGGRVSANCGGDRLTRIVLDVPLDATFAGAGLFDLDGRAIGLVVLCDGRPAAISMSEVRRTVADAASVGGRLRALYGVSVTPLDDRFRAYFGIGTGLVVTAIDLSAPMARQLRAGDAILSLDGHALASEDDLRPLVAAEDSSTHVLLRRRGAGVAAVPMLRRQDAAPADGMGDRGIAIAAEAPPRGVRIDAVRAGSVGDIAGLSTGDRLIRVGNELVTSESAAHRLLASASTPTIFIVFERAGIQRGALIDR